MFKKYWYKFLAPVLITIILLIALVSQLLFTSATAALTQNWWLVAVMCVIFGGGCGVSVFVLWERIKEIESGEEDDLSKY